MFIERLTREQVEGLGTRLAYEAGAKGAILSRGYTVSVYQGGERQNYTWILDVRFETSHIFNMSISLIQDYKAEVLVSGRLSEAENQKEFAKFMYSIFGEDYKKGYLANAAKIFDEA